MKFDSIYSFNFRLKEFGIVFISCPDMSRELLCREDKYPLTILPEAWRMHAQEFGVKRGLMFLDGEKWWEVQFLDSSSWCPVP